MRHSSAHVRAAAREAIVGRLPPYRSKSGGRDSSCAERDQARPEFRSPGRRYHRAPTDAEVRVSDELMVRYERDGAIAVITLDRSPVNAYDDAFHVEFQAAWQQAKTDDSRAVVMRATGRHFCVGANLKEPLPAAPGAHVLAPEEEIRLISSVMKPTIAAVQGGCIGGGQRMVWPCDLVFCTEDAFFMDPTVTMGIGG